jgi:hypothetical protein
LVVLVYLMGCKSAVLYYLPVLLFSPGDRSDPITFDQHLKEIHIPYCCKTFPYFGDRRFWFKVTSI